MLGFSRHVVEGDSMLPAFAPGDRVLVRRKQAKVGDVVVLADPRSGQLILKRVHARIDGDYDVRGDNDAASTDSRHFGAVAPAAMMGVVVRSY